MTRKTLLFLCAALAIAGGAVGLGLSGQSAERGPSPAAAAQAKTPLLLLTSLPIYFSESFSLDAPPSPLRDAIEARNEVRPIDVADAASLKGARLLLMLHARAQPAEALEDLDAWVRQGGRLLLTADPRLEWPSERPLGDRLRPPPDFADTGLLAHWGLALAGPDPEGEAQRSIGGQRVIANSPGRLSVTGPDCRVDPDGFIARCTIGRGRVTVVADADWLDVPAGEQGSGASAASLQALNAELDQLEH